jgi:hypothetical protein
MRRKTLLGAVVLLALLAGTAAAQVVIRIGPGTRPAGATLPAPTPTPARPTPKLEAVAETRLLMEGMAQPNFKALEKALQDRPADAEAWTFHRGQALLIAETGNLLMLRPPRNAGQEAWLARATDLRTAAAALAREAGGRDLERSRAALTGVAHACNRCHETFRVALRVGPDAGGDKGRMTE